MLKLQTSLLLDSLVVEYTWVTLQHCKTSTSNANWDSLDNKWTGDTLGFVSTISYLFYNKFGEGGGYYLIQIHKHTNKGNKK